MGARDSEQYDRLVGRLQHRDRQIEAALAIAEALSSRIDVDDVLRQTLRLALATVKAAAGSVILYDPDRRKLVFRYVLPEDSAMLEGFEMEPTEGIAGSVFVSGRTRITPDVGGEPDHRHEVAKSVRYVPRNMVTVPLKSGGEGIGVLQVLDMLDGEFDEEDCELLEIVAAQAAAMLINARLAEEAQLAAVMNRLGDISHDIKNMLTPVESCAQTIELILEDTLASIDTALRAHPDADPKLVAEINDSVEMLRDFYPDAVQMLLDGATNVQDRVREIADCV